MKFYYNGNLIRTSKNHHYTHAVINENEKALTCSATRQGCEQFIQRYINESLEGIENSKNAIKALNAGKKGYYIKYGRITYWHSFSEYGENTVEKCEEWIEHCKNRIEWIKANWKIVEIEERA